MASLRRALDRGGESVGSPPSSVQRLLVAAAADHVDGASLSASEASSE